MSYISIEDLMKIEKEYNSIEELLKYYKNVDPNKENYDYCNGKQAGITSVMKSLGYKLEARTLYGFKVNEEELKEKKEDGTGTDDESDTETEAFEG